MTEQKKIDGRTKRAADMALAKRTISRASYDALLAGRIGITEAKAIGRDGAPAADTRRDYKDQGEGQRTSRSASAEDRTDRPPQPVSRISKDDTRQLCWCGCQQLTSAGKRWRVGHDSRGKAIIKRAVKEGNVDKLSVQLREYGEERGLI